MQENSIEIIQFTVLIISMTYLQKLSYYFSKLNNSTFFKRGLVNYIRII